MPMKIHESAENYLEAILVLKQERGVVRSIDISRHMNFTKPSVSRAVGILRDGGYISIDAKGFIALTDVGLELAKKIYERHTVLTKVLISLGVDENTASEDACRIEHVISDDTFSAIKKYCENLD